MRGHLPVLAASVALAAVYFVAGKVGLLLAFENASASPVWPATGIAIAALVLGGLRLAPAVFVGAFLVNMTTAGTVGTSAGIAMGNMLEAATAAWFTRRFLGGPRVFSRARDVLTFSLVAAASAAISATVGIGTLFAGGLTTSGATLTVWTTWWLGDLVGALLVAPLILLWATHRRGDSKDIRLFETTAVFAAVVLLSLVVFFNPSGPRQALAFLLLPPILWAAIRLGRKEVATFALLTSAMAIAGTIRGSGPFADPNANTSLMLLQGFLGVIFLVGNGLASLEFERARTAEALARSRDILEARVEERTAALASVVTHLRESEALLKRSQEIAHVGSWEWKIPSNEVAWSDELYHIFGLDKTSVVADYAGYLAALPPADAERADALVRQALVDRQPFEFDHQVVRPGGEKRWIRGLGEVICDEDGNPLRMVGTAQDITEEKAAREERAAAQHREQELEKLREADAFRTHLLSAVSHELKTPLTPLTLQLHLLKKGLLGPTTERQARAVDILDRNLGRLGTLVDQTLEVARIQGGRMRLQRAPVDLSDVVHDIAETYAETAMRKGVELRVESTKPLLVDGDHARLSQVLINLISNAIKFTPAGGEVVVSAHLSGAFAEIRVKDSGAGMDPGEIASLFPPVMQLAQGREAGGTGLGLYISQGIATAHGGMIVATSPGPGKGATFCVRLPTETSIRP